jgi:hypothetical protein
VTWLDWRWIFYINLPMAVLAVWLVGRYIPDIRDDVNEPFDWLGFVLSGIALGCLLFGCEFVSRSGQGWLAVLLLGLGTTTGLAYLRHAQGNPGAILDLTLLKDQTFRLSVIAGSITRVTQGAQPFLLPLMMQLAFGFSAARSGTITVATACGSLAMKSMAPRLLRRFGFRMALVWNGIFATMGYAVCGLFSPAWTDWQMFGVLSICGMSMSFQFTAYNTIAYAGIEKEAMSRATAFYATFQQLMLSLGICAGAMALHGAMLIDGHVRPAHEDFSVAFWAVCTISLTATIWNLRFAPDAGAEISGHAYVEGEVEGRPDAGPRRSHAPARQPVRASVLGRDAELPGPRRQRTERPVARGRGGDEGQRVLVEHIVDVEARLHGLERPQMPAVANVDIGVPHGVGGHVRARRVVQRRPAARGVFAAEVGHQPACRFHRHAAVHQPCRAVGQHLALRGIEDRRAVHHIVQRAGMVVGGAEVEIGQTMQEAGLVGARQLRAVSLHRPTLV